MRDLLGVEIAREGKLVTMRQKEYITRLSDEYLTPEQRNVSVDTPCDKELAQRVLAAADSDMSAVDPSLLRRFQGIVGALLYCSTNTRPDIAYSVGQLSRVTARPTTALLADAERVLMYLRTTQDLGLCFQADRRKASGMTDSDWAVRHSTSGWVFQYGSAAISWGSKKQKTVALSSCEAEIMAASESAKEALYLKKHLEEMGLHDGSPMSLSSDNSAAIALTYNPEHHDRVKHIERRHFFIREAVANDQLVVPYVPTAKNMADFFTKCLPPRQFKAMRNEIMNCDPDLSALHGQAMMLRRRPQAYSRNRHGHKVSREWTIARMGTGPPPYPTADARWDEVTASHVMSGTDMDAIAQVEAIRALL